MPADMVVNAMLVAMVAHAGQPSDEIPIYHVGSSVSNPVNYQNLCDYMFRYFTAKPWINKDGKPVKVGKFIIWNSMESFHRYIFIRYLLPLKGLGFLSDVLCKYFQQTHDDLSKKIRVLMRLAELYRVYLFFHGIFDNMNSVKLLAAARQGLEKKEMDLFEFDPKMIDWEDYFMNIHLPAVVKYLLK
ncbi:hypothetical protein PIB30_087814 [Stylosanthes scabra]|uniref:Fatty acyl-CoA reductase C-terminal domain-containing protein n=1 Tax=Stylosanthes scabra TaxID=79078 RepID=A0ABU6VTC1_9FABA|nr:hypothetical protein [Stylosanthes scabra]